MDYDRLKETIAVGCRLMFGPAKKGRCFDLAPLVAGRSQPRIEGLSESYRLLIIRLVQQRLGGRKPAQEKSPYRRMLVGRSTWLRPASLRFTSLVVWFMIGLVSKTSVDINLISKGFGRCMHL